MKKRVASLILVCVFLIRCIPAVGAASGGIPSISSFQLAEQLTSIVTETLYGGDTQEVTYINRPADQMQYLLVYLTVNVTSGSVADLDDMAVMVGGGTYSRITDDDDLANHGYTPMRHGSATISSSGWTVFEVPDSLTEADLTAGGTLSVGGTSTVFMVLEEEAYLIQQEEYDGEISRQQALEESYLTLAQEGDYTPENPYIIMNPYEIAPQAALILFETEVPVTVTSVIQGKGTGTAYELTTITNTVEGATTWHEIPLVGLYEGENTVELVLSDGTAYTHTITTETAPSYLTNMDSTVQIQSLEELSTGLYQLKDEYRTLWDVNGDLRGYITLSQDASGMDEVTEEGHIFSALNSYTDYATVYEWDYMGYLYRQIDTDHWGVDHDGYLMDNLLIAEDLAYDLDAGAFVNQIDWAEIFNDSQGSFQVRDQGGSDWLHFNTVADGGEGYILVSMRNQHAVAKLSYPEFEVQWVLSVNEDTLVRAEDQDKYLTPVGEEFEWFYSQHHISLVSENEDGTIDITLFDNGAERGLEGTTDDYNWEDMYSRMVHYRIDETAMTVEQIWDWGQDYGVEGFAAIRSSTQYIADSDSYLGCFDGGNNGRSDEGNTSPEETLTTSKVLEVNRAGEIIFFLELSDNAYRVEKLSTDILYAGWAGLGEGDGTYIYASATPATPYSGTDSLIEDAAIYQINGISATEEYLTVKGWVAQEADPGQVNVERYLILTDKATGTEYRYGLSVNGGQSYNNVPQEYIGLLTATAGFYQEHIHIQSLADGDYTITLVAAQSGGSYAVETRYILRIGEVVTASIPVTSTDRLATQAVISSQLAQTISNGNHTLSNPYVALDPYDASPLSALIAFDTDEVGSVTVEIAGKDAYTTLTHTFSEETTSHILPIYGLYGDTNNQVTVTYQSVSGETETQRISIQTGALPNDIAIVDVTVADTSEMAEGFTFGTVEGGGSYAVDANGDIRWYSSFEIPATPIKRLANGNILSGSPTMVDGETTYTSLYEFDLLGRVYNEFLIYGVHHEAVELENGDLLVAASIGDTVEDYVVRLDRTTGEIIQDWSFQDILDMEYLSDESWQYHVYNNQTFNNPNKTEEAKWTTVMTRSASDWFHNNALYYNEEENTILASGRMKDSIVKFDADTGEVIWILADPNVEWAQTTYADKMLTPMGDDFEYSYGQHAITMTDDGDILLFDNGNYRSKVYDDALSANETYSRGVRYSIDEENMTVEQVWEYGKELGSYAYSSYISDIDYLGEDHYLINFGGILGDFATGERYNASSFLNSADAIDPQGFTLIVEVKDDVVVNEMVIVSADGTLNTYRAERMNAYAVDESYVDLTMVGQRLGSLAATETVNGISVPMETGDIVYTIYTIEDSGEDVFIDIEATNFQGGKQYIVLDNGINKLVYDGNSVVKYGLAYGAYEIGILVVDIAGGRHYTQLRQYITVEPQGYLTFIDVISSDWYYGSVVSATAAGLFSGTSATTFSPNETMTRSAMWTVLARESGDALTTGANWYTGAQQWVQELGISDGTEPDGNISREEFVVMLYRYCGEPAIVGNLDDFQDATAVSDWAYDAMVWATANGIVSGSTGGNLNPRSNATRAEAAKMLVAYLALEG